MEPRKRGQLIHLLHQAQSKEGYISGKAIAAIAHKLKISEGEVFGVVTFYKGFFLKPQGKHKITLCMGTACHVRGAPLILDELERTLNIPAGETTADRMFTLETVNCVGACALGPIVIVDGEYHGQMKPREIKNLLAKMDENLNRLKEQ